MRALDHTHRFRFARFRQRLSADDPGGFSRRAALRALLSFVGSGLALLALHQSAAVALLGGSMAMTICVSVSAGRDAEEATSMALATMAAAAGVAAGSLAAGSAGLATALLCALVFAGTLARALGSRGSAIGMLAFMGCFFALFIGARPAQVPWLVTAVAAGGVAAMLVRFVFVREHPQRVHESVLRAFRARLLFLLEDLTDELARGTGGERRLRRIRRATGRVNEAALALEEVMGRVDGATPAGAARPWLREIVAVEVAVGMLAEAAHRIAEREWSGERRHTLAEMLRALQRWIDDDSPGVHDELLRLQRLAEEEARADLADAARDPALLASRERVWARVRRAVALIVAVRPWDALPALPATRLRVTAASFRVGGGGTAGLQGRWPNLRLAAQSAIAVGLAIFAGRAISTSRWYWAALAAFVVFSGATTFAETLSRAWQRFFGTLLGVALGLGIAQLIGVHVAIGTVVALLALFASYALLRVSYIGMVLFTTVALALLYQLTGKALPGLMELRLEETAAGAAIAVLVAAVVFPMHSAGRIRRLVAVLLREVALAVERATTPGVDPRHDEELHDDIRRVDQALSEVRNALRPLWAPRLPFEPARITRQGRTAAALAYATRRVLTEFPSGAADAETARTGARVVAECRAVAEALERGEAPPTLPVATAMTLPAPETDSLACLVTDLEELLRRLVVESGLSRAA